MTAGRKGVAAMKRRRVVRTHTHLRRVSALVHLLQMAVDVEVASHTLPPTLCRRGTAVKAVTQRTCAGLSIDIIIIIILLLPFKFVCANTPLHTTVTLCIYI